jgi:hypothetical protein
VKSSQAVTILLDALGFRGIWDDGDPDKTADRWNRVVNRFKGMSIGPLSAAFAAMDEREKREKGGARPVPTVLVRAFSDTIVICVMGPDLEGMFRKAGEVAVLGFVSALAEGIFLRGAISVGNVYGEGDTLVGPGVDDAADWFDKADWIGVNLTPAASYMLKTLPMLPDAHDAGLKTIHFYETDVSLVKRKVPESVSPKIKTYALNWPWLFADPNWNSGRIRLLQLFGSRGIDSSTRTKYENTLDFFDILSGHSVIKYFVSDERKALHVKAQE